MKLKIGLGAIALVLLANAASAQDRAPTAKWSGFHIGGEVGEAWGSYSWSNINPNYFNTTGATLLGTELDQRSSGVVAGVLGGYSWAVGPVVLGPELAVRTGSLYQQQPTPWFPNSDAARSEIYWMASATLRAGYVWDRWQVFAKGGWAGADVGLTLIDPGGGVVAGGEKWLNGWTAGVGAEYMLFERISVGLTWDYSDLSASGAGMRCPACGSGVGFGTPVLDPHIRLNAVMARVTFHPG